jgi:hypothetical protein
MSGIFTKMPLRYVMLRRREDGMPRLLTEEDKERGLRIAREQGWVIEETLQEKPVERPAPKEDTIEEIQARIRAERLEKS